MMRGDNEIDEKCDVVPEQLNVRLSWLIQGLTFSVVSHYIYLTSSSTYDFPSQEFVLQSRHLIHRNCATSTSDTLAQVLCNLH